MINHPPDLLQLAHLEYTRGKKEEARELLNQLISMQPDNVEAVKLREQIELEIVEDEAVVNAKRDEDINMEMPGWQIVLLTIIALYFIITGVWNFASTAILGFQVGFGTEVPMHVGRYGGTAPLPVHLGLFISIIKIALGAGGARIVCLNMKTYMES